MGSSAVGFSVMDKHVESPGAAPAAGKVVLSRLPRGQSVISSPAASLKLVLEGEETYEVEGRMLRVRPGQFLYLDAGSDCIAHLSQPSRGLCLLLPSDPSRPPATSDPLIGRAMTLPTVTTLMGQTVASYASRIARQPALGEQLSAELVARVASAISTPITDMRAALERLNTSKPATRRAMYQRLEQARAHLYRVTDRAVGLPELATISGMSQFHLARYFKLAFGQPPIAYHRALRLDRATWLLRQGETCLARVAEATGYSDQVALTHAFTRRFGCSPKRWVDRAVKMN